MKGLFYFFLLSSLFILSIPCEAGIYKWEDERGVIHFTNCPRDPQFKLYIRDSKDDPDPSAVSAAPASPSASRFSIKDSTSYDPMISELCDKYGVDFALIKAIIRAESGFNPIAVSRKGARGLMQLMPETASRVNVTNPFNPRENIEGGVRHFKYLLSLFNNDLKLSLAAYNAGENLVAQRGAIPPYRETIEYVQRVMDFYKFYKP
jgi:soluble lytic murein transglycosylase-like protein